MPDKTLGIPLALPGLQSPEYRCGGYVAGRAKTGQRGALKTGQCFDDAYTSSLRFPATFS
jgi:hypothetical protein